MMTHLITPPPALLTPARVAGTHRPDALVPLTPSRVRADEAHHREGWRAVATPWWTDPRARRWE